MGDKLATVAIMSYPLVSHLAIWNRTPLWLAVYLLGLGLLLLGLSLVAKTPRRAWPGGTLTGIGAILLGSPGDGAWLFYLPPFLILGGLLWLFGASLRRGRVPLITRVAEFIDELPLSAEKRRYTRQVTVVWCGFFLAMLLELLALAWWAPLEVWSWFANVFNYGAMFGLLVGEFLLRRHRFGRAQTGTLARFLKRLSRCRHLWTVS